MTPLEFLYRLKQLPSESRLAFAHLGALFEMLTPVLTRGTHPFRRTSLSGRLNRESDLAASLGESVATVQSWRFESPHSQTIWYRLSSVMEWITKHILPVFAEPEYDQNPTALEFSDIAAIWKEQLPAMRVGDDLIGFFRSVRDETEPSEYSLADVSMLATVPSEMGRDELENITASLDAFARFSVVIEASPEEAREIYTGWKDAAVPEVLLQFFRASLAYDEALAIEIAASLDDDLIRRGFNITTWFWQQLLQYDACTLDHEMFIRVFKLAAKHGVAFNQLSHVSDTRQHELFHGNVSHLLADSKGDLYNLKSFDDCPNSFNHLTVWLLDVGLNIDKPNNRSLTARSIAEMVIEKHGPGQSIFKKTVSSYELHQRLEKNLTAKPPSRPKRGFKQ